MGCPRSEPVRGPLPHCLVAALLAGSGRHWSGRQVPGCFTCPRLCVTSNGPTWPRDSVHRGGGFRVASVPVSSGLVHNETQKTKAIEVKM